MSRPHYIGCPEFFELSHACSMIVEAFGWSVYLVGSSLTKRDFRDVDVRCILPDEEFDQLFPSTTGGAAYYYSGRWSLLCASISLWLSKHSGLPVDFQFQRQTEANAEFAPKDGHHRNALGVFVQQESRVPA